MLDLPAHRSKTEGYLSLTINHRRDLTFTTLLGQVVRTRTHDYGQYLRQVAPDDLATRRDLANRLVYAAYVADPGRGQPPPGVHRPRVDDSWITLTHTVLGRRHAGAAPGAPTVPELRDRLDRHARHDVQDQHDVSADDSHDPAD